ncbi:MAG: imidazole glycerol phosphate synthase subunit HisF [bacterium]
MKAYRIIPCLDVDKGRVVKGISFVNLVDAGDPVEQAEIYDKEGADELVFLDITASYENRKIIIDIVRACSECIFIPFTVGGGIVSLLQIEEILKNGADRVSINTAAIKKPSFIDEASLKFGSQCIVVAIDAKRKEDSWEVYINGGRNPAGISAIEWAKEVEGRGAGEILLTSMDCDGKKTGYDLLLIERITGAVNIPVIASGGAGCPEHLYQAISKGADAVLAASIFHYGEYKIRDVKEYLKNKGICVRI